MRELALAQVTMAEKHSSVQRSTTSALAIAGTLFLAACNQTGGLKIGWDMFMSSLEPNVRQQQTSLTLVGAAPPEALDACQRTIAAQAAAHGAIQVEVISAGPPRRLPNGINEAPVEARITYQREHQLQIRQANVACRLDDKGSVVALL
jgi:hypothetical protein